MNSILKIQSDVCNFANQNCLTFFAFLPFILLIKIVQFVIRGIEILQKPNWKAFFSNFWIFKTFYMNECIFFRKWLFKELLKFQNLNYFNEVHQNK